MTIQRTQCAQDALAIVTAGRMAIIQPEGSQASIEAWGYWRSMVTDLMTGDKLHAVGIIEAMTGMVGGAIATVSQLSGEPVDSILSDIGRRIMTAAS